MWLLAELTLALFIIAALVIVGDMLSYVAGVIGVPSYAVPLIHLLYASLFTFAVSIIVSIFIRLRRR